MRESSNAYRLTFILPEIISLAVQPGRHQPCLHGCVLTIERGGLVAIIGPSRQQTFDQAARFLKVHCKGRPAMSIAAVLDSPSKYCPRGSDGWSIIVGAGIAFSPTAMEPHIIPAVAHDDGPTIIGAS